MQLAEDFNMTPTEVDFVIEIVARNNPGILIGGYRVDWAILGIWKALGVEDLPREDVYTRINECLGVMYAGLI
jgi:hypothetical protein